MIIKLVLGNDIRRISLEGDQLKFGRLLVLCGEMHKLQAESVQFQYEDDEGDLCRIASEEELEEAVRLCKNETLKLMVMQDGRPVLPALIPAPSASLVAPLASPNKSPVPDEPISQALDEEKEHIPGSCSFVRENLPDGSFVPPGAIVAKSWRVRNTGQRPWGPGSKFLYVCGPKGEGEVELGSLPPGKEADLTVNIRMPDLPGRYKTNYRLVDATGVAFAGSPELWADLIVQDPSKGLPLALPVGLVPAVILPPVAQGQAAQVFRGYSPDEQVAALHVFLQEPETIAAFADVSELVLEGVVARKPSTEIIDLVLSQSPALKRSPFVEVMLPSLRPRLTAALDAQMPTLRQQLIRHIADLPSQATDNWIDSLLGPKQLQPKPPVVAGKLVHRGVACDKCGVSPVIGTRHKCMTCQKFDLCEVCYQNGREHQHPMAPIENADDEAKAQKMYHG